MTAASSIKPPYFREICEAVNSTPLIASLLYDLNLLPEQVDDTRWHYTMAAVWHMKRAAGDNAWPSADAADQDGAEARRRNQPMTPKDHTATPLFDIKTEDRVEARYKGHDLSLERSDYSTRWYIRVTAPDGCYAYDGWWRDSEGKTADQAVAEAIRGACIEEASKESP